MTKTFNDFVNIIRKDPKIRNKINDMLDRYNGLPPKNQSKTGYDILIQIVILKELKNIMGCTTTDWDIEIKIRTFQRKQNI